MKKAAIIQVRMDSSRFPGKALKPILNKPLLWHVIERSKKINIPIIVATSTRTIDDPIAKLSSDCNVEIFRGSFEDVVDRYYQTSKKYSLNQIFRISADTPLIDPRFCSKMVKIFETKKIDYVRFGYNTIGIGMEGFTFEAIEQVRKNAIKPQDLEHVTKYIKEHPHQFKIHVIESDYNLGNYNWTVENPYDLKFVNQIFEEFHDKEIFYTEDILKLFIEKPHLMKIK